MMNAQQENELRELKHALGILAGVLFTAAVLTMPAWMIVIGWI